MLYVKSSNKIYDGDSIMEDKEQKTKIQLEVYNMHNYSPFGNISRLRFGSSENTFLHN